MSNIFPKCLNGQQDIGHTARGFIIPCCWWDRSTLFESEIKHLVQEKFKLSNVESISQVIESEEWKGFYTNLAAGQGPKLCQTFCGGKEVKKIQTLR